MLRDLLYYTQLLLEAAVGVVGIRTYEEPRHAVVAELAGGVEVRRYAPRLAAQVEVAGRGDEARDEAFRALFRYIAGANAGSEKVAMTTPVATESRGEKLAMTVPVGTETTAGSVRMQFFLPSHYSLETAPRPANASVQLLAIPEQTFAVLRFSGRGREDELSRRKAELIERIMTSGWRASGEPAVLFYDAPFTVPFLRRNEVAVPVEAIAAERPG
jgi:hypothetical protein